jgi:hypothetical protein
MLVNDDRIEHMPGTYARPTAALSELVLGVLLFVRDATSKDLMVSTAAAQERLTITFSTQPFSNPVSPNKPSNSAASAVRSLLPRPISAARPTIPFHPA